MLVRIWRKYNPCSLLVGIQNGAAVVEKSIAVPQKIKHEIAMKVRVLVAQLSNSRDPTDCSPPGISQGRILEWVAISFSRVSS